MVKHNHPHTRRGGWTTRRQDRARGRSGDRSMRTIRYMCSARPAPRMPGLHTTAGRGLEEAPPPRPGGAVNARATFGCGSFISGGRSVRVVGVSCPFLCSLSSACRHRLVTPFGLGVEAEGWRYRGRRNQSRCVPGWACPFPLPSGLGAASDRVSGFSGSGGGDCIRGGGRAPGLAGGGEAEGDRAEEPPLSFLFRPPYSCRGRREPVVAEILRGGLGVCLPDGLRRGIGDKCCRRSGLGSRGGWTSRGLGRADCYHMVCDTGDAAYLWDRPARRRLGAVVASRRRA